MARCRTKLGDEGPPVRLSIGGNALLAIILVAICVLGAVGRSLANRPRSVPDPWLPLRNCRVIHAYVAGEPLYPRATSASEKEAESHRFDVLSTLLNVAVFRHAELSTEGVPVWRRPKELPVLLDIESGGKYYVLQIHRDGMCGINSQNGAGSAFFAADKEHFFERVASVASRFAQAQE